MQATERIESSVKADAAATPLVHFWSACVGAGRANEGLRAGWQEQLRRVHDECGFGYCRFHGLFHDDMFVHRVGVDGRPVYNFQYVDELFDRMLSIGVKPFVEFGFCPADLASQLGTVFWWKGHGSPPKDYAAWAELIDRAVRHWVERYGIAEVRTWYFEVWNEPNLHPFFKGTRTQYFELYRATVTAVKQVDADLRVGGPATSNFVPDDRFVGELEDVAQHAKVVNAADPDALDWRPVWVEGFLAFCHGERLPVDFVSCHPYPTDWALDAIGTTVKTTRGVGATPRDLALIRELVNRSPFPRAEIHLTEWSSSPSPRDHTHDFPQAATFVVRANIESIGLVDSMSYWTFTDVFEEGGAGDTAFHGGFGMITYRGVPKPTFHAYRFLHALGDELLERRPGVVVTRHRDAGRLTALAYHYPPEVTQSVPASFDTRDVADATLATGTDARLVLTLSGLRPHAKVRIETMDRRHGNALAAWRDLGEPASPAAAQLAVLSAAAEPRQETMAADAAGRFELDRLVEPWSVMLVDEVG
jgi:xylan 1,4-beta-xylosidase